MMITSHIQLIHESGKSHLIQVSLQHTCDGIELRSVYQSGTSGIAPGTQVAYWPVTISLPVFGDPGHVWIGDGRIDIEVPELRGFGLGSLFMSYLIPWIKKQPNLPLVTISLSREDAKSSWERDTRNQFYERLGITFDYEGNREWGKSNPINSHDLRCPQPKFKNGWRADKI